MKFEKVKTSLLALLVVVVLAITGCESTKDGNALQNQAENITTTEQIVSTQAATEQSITTQDAAEQVSSESDTNEEITSSDIVLVGSTPLTVEDLLIDVSALSIPDYSGTDFYIVNDNVPFFNDKLKNYTGDNFIYLSELDELGRCGTCIGLFTNATLPTEKRGEIGHVKPSGWHTAKYDKSVIPDLYLYNRCHLLMYAVSGINDDTRNLITGTRQLNLDMLELETQVLDTIKYDESERLLYRVTPLFEGDNLVAKGVLMEAASLENEDGLSFCMFIYNVQDGIVIDYATGDNALADSETSTEATQTNAQQIQDDSTKQESETTTQIVETTTQSAADYVANKSSKKFHYPWCDSVEKMKPENRMDYTGTRDELIDMGYEPCKRCEP